MRIAYVFCFNPTDPSGIWNKVIDQVGEWRRLGHTVEIFGASRKDLDIPIANVVTTAGGQATLQNGSTWKTYGSLVEYGLALRSVAEATATWNPDVVYLRYSWSFPSLTHLSSECPVVLEINADDVSEYRTKSWRRRLYNRATRKRLLRAAAGYVFISDGIARSQSFESFDKPKVVIGNSISLRRFEVAPPPTNEAPRLIFMAQSPEPWHGTDKLLQLAKTFPLWRFDLVGLTPSQVGDLEPNITCWGLLPRYRYKAIIDETDVGIGTLSLHAKGMEDNSPLKVREYLASGLPTIIGYKDVDFPDGAPFILQLPNRPDSIVANVRRIERFVLSQVGQRVDRRAIQHLDVSHKERQRLRFFRQCIDAWDTGGGRR